MVITGNTTMLYLLLGRDVVPLSAAPFTITDFLGETVSPEQCGFSGFKNASVYLPRAMSAFVGSDITCCLLAARDLLDGGGTALLADMGTNGEMAICRRNQLICCSTAAGPAFEGAGITMGCMAISGAINRVYMEDGIVKYTVIGEKKPCGICGSGLIDALAAFLSLGLIDRNGGINISNENYPEYITDYAGKPALLVGDSGIVITQADIRAAQLAKAAICAGIYTLLEETGTLPNEIDRLVTAGGFGSYIDIQNACAIGLIPFELQERAISAGNAAAAGAVMLLLSGQCRSESVAVAKRARIIDLSASGFFMEKYIECMSFPKRDYPQTHS